MRICSITGTLALLLAASSASVQAGDCCTPCVTKCCVPQITWVEKTVTCYRTEMREREVTCTIYHRVCKEVTETRTITCYTPEHRVEKRTIVCMRPVCTMVEKTITCLQPVQVACVDPCTGCQTTCCKLQPVQQKVTVPCTTFVKEERVIEVPVCVLKPYTKEVQCTRLVTEFKPEQIKTKQCYAVLIPYETKVCVPVCTLVCN